MPEEVPPPTPAEVKPPPPEEVKRLKPPWCKVARQPVVPLRAPKVNVEDASFSVKMRHRDFLSLGKVTIHLGVQRPTDLMQTTMVYAFKINVLAGELEKGMLYPVYDDGGLDVSSFGSSPTPTMGLPRRRLPLLLTDKTHIHL
jgi:hypothetical protein